MRLIHGLILLPLFFLPLCAVSGTLLGGWSVITNLRDPHVTAIAKFAVSEHNKRSGESLEFVKVVKGEKQVTAGINFRLVLVAKVGSSSALKKYEAVVLEKVWENFLSLTSFKPVLG